MLQSYDVHAAIWRLAGGVRMAARSAFQTLVRSAVKVRKESTPDYYGPTQRAFAALGDKAGALRSDISGLLERMNTAKANLRVPSTYLEVILTKP